MNNIIAQDIDEILKGNKNFLDYLSGSSILVTGANGFLPSYIVNLVAHANENYLSQPCKIFSLVRNREKAERKFQSYLKRDYFQILTSDLSSPLVGSDKYQFTVHAASQASPKYYNVDPVGTLSPNTIGTYHLLEYLRKSSCQSFLFFSSSEVYGQTQAEQNPVTEKTLGHLDPVQVRSCYGESKRMGENICISYHHQYGIPAKIARPFHTYGPGLEMNDGRVFADFVRDIVTHQDIVMKSDGSALRSYCYAADATTAFLKILFEGKNGEAYNVGNPDNEVSVLELAHQLIGLFPEKNLKLVPYKRPENDNYMPSKVSRVTPDISKIKSLGWNPQTDIRTGFYRTVKSYE